MPYTMTIFFDEVAMALEAANVLYSTPALHISELTITDQSGDPFADPSTAPGPSIEDSWEFIAQRDIATRAAEAAEVNRAVKRVSASPSKRARLDNEKVWMNIGCPECGVFAGRPCVGEKGADLPVSHYTRKMAYDHFLNCKAEPVDAGYKFPTVTLDEM